MQREIKFRGRSKLNGKWAFGAFIPRGDDWCSIIVNNPEYGDLDNNEVRIITETIGQYTGLKDKNGVEIYEGDVIQFAEKYFYVVKYEDGKFVGYHANNNWGKWGDLYKLGEPGWDKYNYIVIGNIYENPELISQT